MFELVIIAILASGPDKEFPVDYNFQTETGCRIAVAPARGALFDAGVLQVARTPDGLPLVIYEDTVLIDIQSECRS